MGTNNVPVKPSAQASIFFMHRVASQTNLFLSLDWILVICLFFFFVFYPLCFHTFFTVRRLIDGLGWNSAGIKSFDFEMKVSCQLSVHACMCALEFVSACVCVCEKLTKPLEDLSLCRPLSGVVTDCSDRLIYNLSIFTGSAIWAGCRSHSHEDVYAGVMISSPFPALSCFPDQLMSCSSTASKSNAASKTTTYVSLVWDDIFHLLS